MCYNLVQQIGAQVAQLRSATQWNQRQALLRVSLHHHQLSSVILTHSLLILKTRMAHISLQISF